MARVTRLGMTAVLLAALGLSAGMTRASERTMFGEPRLATSPDFRPRPTDPKSRQEIQRAETWIAAGTIPGAGTRWEEMSRWALTDIYQLLPHGVDRGGPPAGAGSKWAYFWPRDGAFLAVALHRTGHQEDAGQIVQFIARLPFDKRVGFDARYLLDGGRVREQPRGSQSDGCGWVLWALSELATDAASAGPDQLPPSSAGLRDRCVASLLDLTAHGAQLPPASPDYWEVDPWDITLGTVAPILVGLRAAADEYRRLGRPDAAANCAAAASRLRSLIAATFAPDYERIPGGGGMDAAVTFLMPPFLPADPAVTARWEAYQALAGRESGGLAPGTAWKQDGTSWTPETALVAYTGAASGRTAIAKKWLDWLDRNRTPWGSLPEKVTRRGRPAGPAPLLWTGALVLLTLDELGSGEEAR